jgi:hypothetical protein
LIVGQEPAKSTKQQQSSVRPTITHHSLCSNVPTHRISSDNSWPKVLGIVPVSWLPPKCLQSKTKRVKSVPPQTKRHRRRHCSNSQLRKRRQLAHGARNRARQLVVEQVPAKATKTTQSLFTNTSPIVASVPTHRISSDDSWPAVIGIVPVS